MSMDVQYHTRPSATSSTAGGSIGSTGDHVSLSFRSTGDQISSNSLIMMIPSAGDFQQIDRIFTEEDIVPSNSHNYHDEVAATISIGSTTEDRFQDYTSLMPVADPIVIRGGGNVTIFGLTNRFDEAYPSQLHAWVAPEEFQATIRRINAILHKILPLNIKWLLFGCFCCCCTLGCSLIPAVCLNKRTKATLNKVLEWENTHLYYKLGVRWRLAQQRCQDSAMSECVILIEFIPKLAIHKPD